MLFFEVLFLKCFFLLKYLVAQHPTQNQMLVSVLAFGWSGVAASHVVPCPPTTTKVDRFAVNGTDWIACEDLKVRKKEKRDESLSETTFSFLTLLF